MKILILTNSFGGLYCFRKEVIKAIKDMGNKVIILAPFNSKIDYFKEIGCQLIDIQFNRKGMNPVKDLALTLRYCGILWQIKPNVVLSYTIKPNLYGGIACQLCKVPQIANITGLGSAIENPGWLQRLTILLYKVGLKKVKTLFFQNRSNYDLCKHLGIANESAKILPGSGVNLKLHTFQPYPTSEGKIRFLFIGRMLRDKGIEEYFEAAQQIKKKYPNSEFQVLGTMEDNVHNQLKQMIRTGIINYLGTTHDVRPFIGSVECTIMPSYHEGMSNVNLESAANGRPVITTDVPGCRETVDDGITGLLVKARDTDSLTKAIERFILMPYEQKRKMGEAARRKMEREFDRQIVVDAYLKEIENITNV